MIETSNEQKRYPLQMGGGGVGGGGDNFAAIALIKF